jgi:hypothetical protein
VSFQNKMKVSRKIAGFGTLALGIAGLLLGLRSCEKYAAEEKRLSKIANETTVKAEPGDAAAQYKLACLYYQGKGIGRNLGESVRWFRKAGDQGYPKAEFSLGDLYHRGEGVPKDDAEAVRWIQKAADQGDPYAESALGHSYLNGEGVPRDATEALTWYRKAAEQGYPLAQQALGYMYFNGQGVEQDDGQAVVWYQKAAEQGDAVAQASLGYMYAYGKGVTRDRIGAIRWYRMAAAQGDPNGRQALALLKPPVIIRYIELGTSVAGLILGMWCLLSSFEVSFVRRKFGGWRQGAITVLGFSLLARAGLGFYASAHDIRYSPYCAAFHVASRILVGIVLVIFVTVVLPTKKQSPQHA